MTDVASSRDNKINEIKKDLCRYLGFQSSERYISRTASARDEKFAASSCTEYGQEETKKE